MNNNKFRVISFDTPFAVGLVTGQAPLHGLAKGAPHRGWCLVHAAPYSRSEADKNFMIQLINNYPYNEILAKIGINNFRQLITLSNHFLGWVWLKKIVTDGHKRHGTITGPAYTWHFTKGSMFPHPVPYIGEGSRMAPELWDLPPILSNVFYTPQNNGDDKNEH